jgi:DNA polymerase-3 subunit gamma/tau
MKQFNRELVEYLRGLLLIKTGSGDSADLVAEDAAELKEIAAGTSLEQVLTAVRIFGQLDLGFDNYPTLPLELALVDCILAGESEPEKPVPEAKSVNPPPPKKEVKPEPEPPVAEIKPEPAPPAPAETRAVKETPEPAVSEIPEDDTETAAEPVAETDETITGEDTENQPEPEPVQAAAGTAPPANGSEFESLKQNWKQVIADAPPDTKKSSAIAILRSAGVTPVALENDIVSLSFRYPLIKEQIEKIENQKVVEKIISNYLGRPCRVTCVLEDNHLLKAALKMGAQIIDQEEK